MKQRLAASQYRLWVIMTSLEVLDVLFWGFFCASFGFNTVGGSGDTAAIFVWVDVSRHFGVVVTPKSCDTVNEQSVRNITEQAEQTLV